MRIGVASLTNGNNSKDNSCAYWMIGVTCLTNGNYSKDKLMVILLFDRWKQQQVILLFDRWKQQQGRNNSKDKLMVILLFDRWNCSSNGNNNKDMLMVILLTPNRNSKDKLVVILLVSTLVQQEQGALCQSHFCYSWEEAWDLGRGWTFNDAEESMYIDREPRAQVDLQWCRRINIYWQRS
jgi:hypothetical protein